MSILLSLTPAESKRLIAKAVVLHPLVQKALAHGNILVSNGTTTAYFVEEACGVSLSVERFACGVITQGVLCQTPGDRVRSAFIQNGSLKENNLEVSDYDELDQLLEQMSAGDVYVKGANAIDSQGNAGFLLAHPEGGNVLKALHKIYAQGIRFVIPVGLEKLISSVTSAQNNMKGINEYSYTFGRGCGYVTVNNGIIIHEIAALELLTGVSATHVASGGVGGSEGSVVLVAEGTDQQEEATIELLKKIKGEPPVPAWRNKCSECPFKCKYRFPAKK